MVSAVVEIPHTSSLFPSNNIFQRRKKGIFKKNTNPIHTYAAKQKQESLLMSKTLLKQMLSGTMMTKDVFGNTPE